MSHKLTIRKGLDIRLEGGISDFTLRSAALPESVAIIPDDYPGFVPKVEVKEGDRVETGQPLLFDKRENDIKLVAPVAGVVKAVVRGERRKIERVVISPNSSSYVAEVSVATDSADDIRRFLKTSGLWAMMRQRPYDIVPLPDSVPRDIFVTAIDSAPLAVDFEHWYADEASVFAAGVALLSRLTKGKVYISRRPGTIKDIDGAEMVDVSGPHPAGNTGVVIANIAPVNKYETVWTLDIVTLWRIGEAVRSGKLSFVTNVAVTGSEVVEPQWMSTVIGADLKSLIDGNLKDDGRHQRIISGNVLTGVHEPEDGYLRYPYRQITVIPEGDDVNEFMGWASISPKKMSQSRSFPGHFLRKKLFSPDARLLGGKRAFIMSGEYDRYMPMDILSEYLIKAIMGRDIEKMEQLGIYEVAPEDFALGEYADTSKLEAQKIVREGLDYLRKELE